MNRYAPHLYIIPEDDCDRQLADGFVLHDQVKAPRVQVTPPPGGWFEVLKTFQTEYIRRLRDDPKGYVVMLIDFDDHYNDRHAEFVKVIPIDLKDRVFVIGAKYTPEALKKVLGKSYESIGKSLADDCFARTYITWGHEHLKHNDADRLRLIEVVRPIIFDG